jgi:hypothetical protein
LLQQVGLKKLDRTNLAPQYWKCVPYPSRGTL